MGEIDIFRYPNESDDILDVVFGYLVLAEYKLYEWHTNANIKHFVEHLEYKQTSFFIDDIKYLSSRDDTYIYILKYNDKFCAYIIFKKDGIDKNSIYISQLYVNIEARMGFAKLLLTKVEEVAEEVKRNKIYLDVAKSNKDAIALYEFADYIRNPESFNKDDWSYEYRKELGGNK